MDAIERKSWNQGPLSIFEFLSLFEKKNLLERVFFKSIWKEKLIGENVFLKRKIENFSFQKYVLSLKSLSRTPFERSEKQCVICLGMFKSNFTHLNWIVLEF